MTDASERTIFLDAVEIASAADREAFLERACQGDPQLRQQVEALLQAHGRGDNVLDRAPAAVRGGATDPTESIPDVLASIAEEPGVVIGAYRLRELIGEGGFGLVFAAEQTEPVRRMTALKILKPGMDTREVIARFEAERQALAMMDHPNIARVFDAGATLTGRPYFVMELVRGVPITEFCDARQLATRDRLQLFITVCRAVQHAHQKGIIHRDIKPSNVLVTLHDGTPCVKVIDFGVAKAVGHSLTDKTIYTRFLAMIGTPLYMSPEQAEMSGLDVDTRSDIYSLGVLLYELMTGATPIDRERIRNVPFDEVRRLIRDEDPPRPSTRLSTLGTQLRTVSENRGVDPGRLTSILRGDVDWIVMKALEKDRTRRYDTASALAEDVRRCLDGEPIAARPPSRLYLMQRFMRRHRAIVISSAVVTLALVLAAGTSLWHAARAIDERDAKHVAEGQARQAQREAEEARSRLADFTARLQQANVLLRRGRAHADAGRHAAAFAEYTEAIRIQPDYYHVWLERGLLAVRLGAWHAAADDYRQALDLQAPVTGPEWWGIPQLFLYVDDAATCRRVCQALVEQTADSEGEQSMAAVRSSAVAAMPAMDPRQLVRRAEALLQSAWFPGDGPRRGRRPRFRGDDEPPEPNRDPLAPTPPPPRSPRGRPGPPDDRFSGPPVPPGPRRRGGPPPMVDRPGGPPRADRFDDDIEFRGRGPAEMLSSRSAALYVAGLAHLRVGDHSTALERLTESQRADRRGHDRPAVLPALALARFQSGQTDAARETLAESSRAISDQLTRMQRADAPGPPVPWFEWIECLVLHREASLVINGVPAPDDPRLRTLELDALATLQDASADPAESMPDAER